MSRVKPSTRNATVRSLEQFPTKLSHFFGQNIVMVGFEEVFVRPNCSLDVQRAGMAPKLGLQHIQVGQVIVIKKLIKSMNRIFEEN